MKRMRMAYFWGALQILMSLILLQTILFEQAWAQGEVTSNIYRYRERVATGYYEGYEVSPRRQRAIRELPATRPGLFPFGLSSALVRIRSRLPDSHRGLKFYERSTCIECHPREARDLHSTRAGITCRQCHGPEPIAAINHYYSPMNPIRRYAYICSKCHEGATANFGGFHVHEPPAGSLETWQSFPVLFVAYWGMLLLLVGTLAFFVPHALMVGARELTESRAFRIPRVFMGDVIDFLRKITRLFLAYLLDFLGKVTRLFMEHALGLLKKLPRLIPYRRSRKKKSGEDGAKNAD